MSKKYLILCNRHDSIFGDNFCLWWGCRDSESGYTSDVRTAHRFDESEIDKFDDSADLPICIDILGINENCESEVELNKNIISLVEKGTICKLTGLVLMPKDKVDYCPHCGEDINS